MKKILLTLVALAVIGGCQREEPFVESDEAQGLSGPEFTAQIETFGSETKTSLSGNSMVWSSGDQLAIFQGKDIADRYQVKDNCVGSGNGTFIFDANGKGTPSVDFDANIAVYPYEDDLICTPNKVDGEVASYTITGVTIPQKQTYLPSSFPDETFFMAAITDGLKDNSLYFKYLCGVLHLQLKGTEKITSIVLSGRNNEPLSGDATITIPNEGMPSLTMCAEADNGTGTYVYRTIMLDCGEGVQLSETEATSFFITVPTSVLLTQDKVIVQEDAFKKGFYLTITDYEGKTQRIDVANTYNKISRSYIHTMPEKKVETASSTAMVCQIKGNDIYVRSRDFEEQHDIYWQLKKAHTSNNRFFNISQIWTIPTTNADNSTTGRLFWKSASDDICPIQVWGEHVGGNHGYNCVDKLTVTGHGKTDTDIGSVWTDSDKNTYVLVFVYDKNTLGVVRYNKDDEDHQKGKMESNKGVVGTSLSHKSGATNTESISIMKQEKEQLWSCSNNHVLKLYVDGVERDLSTDGVILGDRVEILAEYSVIFVPAMLEYLMDNVGKINNDNYIDEQGNFLYYQNSDDIAESYYRLSTRYQFNRNGSVSQYHTYKICKTFDVGYGGLVQSAKLPENDPKIKTDTYKISYIGDPYIYTPDTMYDYLILHDSQKNTDAGNFKMYQSTWSNSNKVPYRYYQFTTEKAEKGMCLVYDRSIGWGQNEERLKHIVVEDNGYAGRYRWDTKKMYPAFFCEGTFEAGLTFDGLASRVPLYKYDEDLTAVSWYWLDGNEFNYETRQYDNYNCDDDAIILMIDSHKAIDKEIFLPAYMNNMKIKEVLDSKNVVCEQTQLDGRKLRYNTGGADYGYLVVRLSK